MPCPVLLRQTSFLALSEYIEFTNPDDGSHEPGHHQVSLGFRLKLLSKAGLNICTTYSGSLWRD